MAKKPEPERTEKRDADRRDINQVVEENPPPVRQPRATETPSSEEANAFDKRPWDWRW